MTTDASEPAGNSPGDSPTGVGRTALIVAAARAAESERADRLFTDPFAADFVAASGFEMPGVTGPPDSDAPEAGSFGGYASIRTRFFDDYLVDATRELRQVVIVAAGLDTRAFRLDLPAEVTVYELDSPAVLAFKQRVLDDRGARPSCRRIPVATDLREDWAHALSEAGFDPAAPSAWLIEGLLPYLDHAQNDRLLATVGGRSSAGSRLALEFVSAEAVTLLGQALTGDARTEMTALWHNGGVADAAEPWLHRHGWDARAYDTYERAHSYHRDLPPPGDGPMDRFAHAARQSLVVAHRR